MQPMRKSEVEIQHPVWNVRGARWCSTACSSWASSTSRPDSFADGGRYFNHANALAHARQLIDEGADIIDIGGESTRPGAADVSPDEEIRRVVPLLEALAGRSFRCRLTPASPR